MAIETKSTLPKIVQNQTKSASSNPKRYRVVIYGWYGIPNVGDEAILASIVNDLRALIPNLHITVFSFDPKHTLKYHNVDHALYAQPELTRQQEKQLRAELANTDLFILGGGGMFHSHSGRRPWLNKLMLAKRLGCKTMLYTVGIDPSSMSNARWRLIWRVATLFADYLSVRDIASKELLQAAGVKKPVSVIADPVFRLTPSPAAAAKQVLERVVGDTQKPLASFGVGMPTYRFGPIDRLDYIEIIAKAGDHLVEQYGLEVLLVPYDMQPNRDRELCLEVVGMMRHRAKGHVLLDPGTPNEVLALNNFMDISLCTRFHSLVFAILTGTPAVSIVYQQKVGKLLEEVQLTDLGIRLQDLTAEALIQKIDTVWANQKELSSRLTTIGSKLAEQALETPLNVARILGVDAHPSPVVELR